MADTWKEYQDEAASFFQALELDAQTNVTIQGVRTTHNVDVVVKPHHAGFDVTWIIECKHWKSRVSKLHVLALREIVTDVGADRGIVLSEVGFQSGAMEAAALTNVRVTSLAEVRRTARSEILSMRLREIYDRNEVCRERYWNIAKEGRIKHGLRPPVLGHGYSGNVVIDLVNELLTKAFRGTYPIGSESVLALMTPGFPRQFDTAEDLVAVIHPMLDELETELNECEARVAAATE